MHHEKRTDVFHAFLPSLDEYVRPLFKCIELLHLLPMQLRSGWKFDEKALIDRNILSGKTKHKTVE